MAAKALGMVDCGKEGIRAGGMSQSVPLTEHEYAAASDRVSGNVPSLAGPLRARLRGLYVHMRDLQIACLLDLIFHYMVSTYELVLVRTSMTAGKSDIRERSKEQQGSPFSQRPHIVLETLRIVLKNSQNPNHLQ